jgi:hypothetical protein
VATLSGHGITGSNCAPTTTENDLALTGTKTPDGFSFPDVTFPGPMTVRTTGSSATGQGRGFIEAFEYNVTVELQQQFGPPSG